MFQEIVSRCPFQATIKRRSSWKAKRSWKIASFHTILSPTSKAWWRLQLVPALTVSDYQLVRKIELSTRGVNSEFGDSLKITTSYPTGWLLVATVRRANRDLKSSLQISLVRPSWHLRDPSAFLDTVSCMHFPCMILLHVFTWEAIAVGVGGLEFRLLQPSTYDHPFGMAWRLIETLWRSQWIFIITSFLDGLILINLGPDHTRLLWGTCSTPISICFDAITCNTSWSSSDIIMSQSIKYVFHKLLVFLFCYVNCLWQPVQLDTRFLGNRRSMPPLRKVTRKSGGFWRKVTSWPSLLSGVDAVEWHFW